MGLSQHLVCFELDFPTQAPEIMPCGPSERCFSILVQFFTGHCQHCMPPPNVLLITSGDFGRERWRSHHNLYRDGCHLVLSVSQGFIKETCKGRESSDASSARDFPQDYSGEGSMFYKYVTGQIQRDELIHTVPFSPK